MKGRTTYEQRSKIWHAKIARVTTHESRIRSMMVEFFKEQHIELEKRIPHLVPSKGIKQQGAFFDINYWDQRLQDKATPFISGAFGDAANDVLDQTEFNYDPVHPQVRQALGERVNRMSKFINQTTDKQIKKRINAALQENAHLGIPAQRAAIESVLSDYFDPKKAFNRANTIAQTEAMGAWNHGTQVGIELGKFERKQWLTSRDAKVRSSHQIDGQVVDAQETFILNDGAEMQYPHDFHERCTMTATVEQRNRPDGTAGEEIKYQDYSSHQAVKLMNSYDKLSGNFGEDTLTEAQFKSFRTYKKNSSRLINKTLRDAKGNLDDVKNRTVKTHVKNMDGDFDSSLPDNTVLYRGIHDHEELYNGIINNTMDGLEILDNGYISTSINRESIFPEFITYKDQPIILKIRAKRGTPVAWLDNIDDQGEFEALLRRGQKIKVIRTWTEVQDTVIGKKTVGVMEVDLL